MNSVTTWMDYTLPDNIQNLNVAGEGLYAAGNSLDNVITVDNSDHMQLYGAGGNNVLVGGTGADTFVIDNSAGSDAIYNWHAGDVIRLTAGSPLQTFAQVQAAMVQQGPDVVVENGAHPFVVRNTTVGQFTAADFDLALDASKLGAPTFDDEFNSLSLFNGTSGTWTPHYWYGGLGSYTLTGNGELQLYTAPGFTGAGTTDLGLNPFSVSNGVLDIHAQAVSSAQSAAMWNYGYSSGVITTHDSFSQTYGYFEMRAELPTNVSGAWPAFWLVPADGSWPPELDVMETLSGTSNVDYTTVHSAAGGSNWAVGSGNLVPDDGGYHTYGVLWTPTELVWYLDGQEVFETATPADMNKPMYMIANLAVGGWAGTPDFTSTDMNIDYIRAYALADGSSTWTSSVAPEAPTSGDPTGSASTTLDGGSTTTSGGSSTTTSTSSTTTSTSSTTTTENSSSTSSIASTSGATAAVTISDADYTAPSGVTSVTLSGSWQTVHGNDSGDTFIVGNNTGNAIYGGAGNDTFVMGRAGDWVSGGGGANTFVFNETPWAGAHIVDFKPTQDTIDLSGLLAHSGYSGDNPIGDGYIRLTSDAAGNAQIWSDLDQVAHAGWWLVATLDGVPVSSLSMQGDIIGAAPGAPPASHAMTVSTSDYVAPAGITDITLTGAWQAVTGNDLGDTFHSDDQVTYMTGGAGNDTFYMGRAGDWAAGAGGNDTFVFQATPWAAGGITDFGAGDKIDLSGLLAASGYTGSDPVGAGYLRISDDGAGNAQIWSNLNGQWWLVTTLQHETAAGLHVNGAFVTG